MRSKIPRPTMTVEDALKANGTSALIRDEREYVFITPVFGGGVRIDGPQKPADPITPVRGSAIRGQLRFWWRAVNPRNACSLEELFKAEKKVFGAAAGGADGSAGTLDVRVVKQPKSPDMFHVLKQDDKFKHEPGLQGLAYGAFPLRDPDEAARHGTLHRYQESWTVVFTYADAIKEDIEAALWAWAHFGGLGGRTRRGFGAIAQRTPTLLSIEEGMKRWLGDRSKNHGHLPWPHMKAGTAVVRAPKSFSEGRDAQEHLLNLLRRLRQDDIGRNHPGRSYWPEPDTIRAATGQSSADHRRAITDVRAAPRAAFGMPIVFHFKDRGDPDDCQLLPRLEGEKRGRLASPLILRPHQCGDGTFEALALVLAHPAPTDVVFVSQGHKTNKYPVRPTVTIDEAKKLKPLNATKGTTAPFTDPLQRYLHLLQHGT